jgi:hypothetical protein
VTDHMTLPNLSNSSKLAVTYSDVRGHFHNIADGKYLRGDSTSLYLNSKFSLQSARIKSPIFNKLFKSGDAKTTRDAQRKQAADNLKRVLTDQFGPEAAETLFGNSGIKAGDGVTGANLRRLDGEVSKLTDVRGNPVVATQRESSWAMGVLRATPPKQVDAMRGHLGKVSKLLKDNNCSTLGSELEREVNNLPPKCTGVHFAEFTLKPGSPFKSAIDHVGIVVKKLDSTLYKQGRDKVPEFKNRGRRDATKDEKLSRHDSFKSKDAGIVAREFRRDSVTNVFSSKVAHAKGSFRSVEDGHEDYVTPAAFRKAGAPFVGGASGTVSAIVQGLELEKSYKDLDLHERQDREAMLGTYFATLVAGGHHSLSECLIAAKAYGYFAEVPHPLKDYNGAMKGLQESMNDLGVPSGGKSLVS